LAQQSREDHIVESTINRRATDTRAVGASREPADQLVGVEMLVGRKNFFDNRLTLSRQPHAARRQVLSEFVRRTDGHRNRRKLRHNSPRSSFAGGSVQILPENHELPITNLYCRSSNFNCSTMRLRASSSFSGVS